MSHLCLCLQVNVSEHDICFFYCRLWLQILTAFSVLKTLVFLCCMHDKISDCCVKLCSKCCQCILSCLQCCFCLKYCCCCKCFFKYCFKNSKTCLKNSNEDVSTLLVSQDSVNGAEVNTEDIEIFTQD